ncbi:MAG TPA: intradiol ring-cleavage dioxygenase [Propionibacteriaceae bacterium]|nr:intradiol ring-cleavage dioxygenase [Propionibacteriaceae bacterium]
MNETKLVRSIQVAALAWIADRPPAKRIPIEEELIMMRVNHRETDLENHDRGLDYDLPRLLHRRGMLKLVAGVGLAGAGLITLGACSSDTGTADVNSPPGGRPPGGGAAGGSETSDTANGELPEETGGPFPGDGSNGANVLNQSGIVRRDITSSFGSSTARAEGVPLTIAMTINDFAKNKSPIAGGAVYVWHCDREGRYSLYSQGVTGENYLRGVQEADDRGQLRFATIFPACYSGRWPHIHFEVYPSLAKATNSENKIATSQMALPEATCQAVYATSGYEQSRSNLGRVSLETDNVFRDGYNLQIPRVSGDPSSGYQLSFTCAV